MLTYLNELHAHFIPHKYFQFSRRMAVVWICCYCFLVLPAYWLTWLIWWTISFKQFKVSFNQRSCESSRITSSKLILNSQLGWCLKRFASLNTRIFFNHNFINLCCYLHFVLMNLLLWTYILLLKKKRFFSNLV